MNMKNRSQLTNYYEYEKQITENTIINGMQILNFVHVGGVTPHKHPYKQIADDSNKTAPNANSIL